MRRLFFSISLVFLCHVASAQLVVDDTYTADQLVDVIVADGIFVENASLICPTGGSGYFDGSATNIGINSGVILTSGSATGANGPNNDISFGVCSNGQGDPQLEAVAGETVFDGCILEFDAVPTCTPLVLSYVFGSDEYPEYINREFVDAMVFTISGPGFGTPTNVAFVPGTTTPVNIGTINGNTNSGYYVNNSGGASIQYDGFTTVLTATADIIPCEKYHIKIAVGDASDCIFDSGIFLLENSFDCGVSNAVTVDANEGPTQPIEGCQEYTVEFCRQGSTAQPFDLNFIIEGTATNGVDYPQLPTTITLPAGVQCTTLTIDPPQDGVNEGGETVEIIYQAISGGCQVLDTVRVTIIDDPALTPDFYYNDVCLGSTTFFNNTTTINPPAVVTDFVWKFGDPPVNGSAATYNTSYQYGAPGQYEVTLIATSTSGCVDSVKQFVNVYDYPTASFVTGTNTVCLGQEIDFANTSTPPSNDVIGQVTWNFGDGGTSHNWDTSHVYSIPDTFPVVLTVYSDILGCSSSQRDTVIVLPNVRSDFIFANVCEGSPVTFLNQSQGYNQNTIWEWDYGDGTLPYGNTFNTTHQNYPADTFDVRLVAITPNGCNDTTIKQLFVFDAPTAYFEVDDVCANELARFTNLSTPPTMGDLDSWFWTFSDGYSSSAFSPTHLFQIPPSNFTATLIVYNSNLSCADTFTTSLVVAPIPNANFTVQNVCDGADVAPLNSTTGVVTQWEWDFGDGTPVDISSTPIHQYTIGPGTYDIQLKATNAFNCSDSITKPITVYNLPESQFEAKPACAGDLIPFQNQSTIGFPDNIVYWIWDYDQGGVIDTVIAASHTYPTGGTYFPELLTISGHGCRDSITIPLTVYHVPDIDVDLTVDEGCSPVCVEFTDLSTLTGDSMVSWLWNFGDLNLTTDRNTTHCYSNDNPFESKFYDVSLTIETDSGCSATKVFDKLIEVYPQPEAEFDWTPDPVSLFEPTVSFIDQSLGADYWGWDFGQPGENANDTSWFQEPEYTFTNYGDFPITLIVENRDGCRDTLVENMHIIPDYTLYVPTAFTPDGDTLNATWGPKGFGIKRIDIRVADRWGRLMFYSDDINNQWNGYDRSHQKAPQGMYVYQIEAETLYKEVYNYTGKLMLMRRDE